MVVLSGLARRSLRQIEKASLFYGGEVRVPGQRLNHAAFAADQPRPAHQQRHADIVLVHVELAGGQAVMPEILPVISGV